ncbi:hypothetical protein ACHAXR_013228 [Thalassiosira sp. AJA248-18]
MENTKDNDVEDDVKEGDGVDVDDSNDTATESYDDESGDDDSQYSYDDDSDGRPLPMPPLKYARIMGSLPRGEDSSSSSALSVKITSSAMGRIVVGPSPYSDKNHESSMPSGSKHGEGVKASTAESATEWTEFDDDEADLSLTKTYHVLALGFEDGKVRLVDALTGGSVLFGSSSGDGGAWFVNPSAVKRGYDLGHKIVALSFDSSSSYLSALNANGDAAIFGPLMWGKQSRRTQSTVSAGESHKFGFLSHFGGKDSDATNLSDKKRILRPPFTLVKPPTSTVRFTYADQQSFGSSILGGGSSGPGQDYHPTCMALDPAYGRRKERALIVGFDDGRLILSKLQGTAGIGSGITSLFGGGGKEGAGGGTTVKKVDSVLFQGVGATSISGDQAGIEAVTWRGGLVAWADSSGVRLFDVESMSRIAHIDRPTGARSSLYPTISSLHPSILFERSDSLLIGWGDCLMSLLVRDPQSSAATSKDGSPTKTKRKTVECTMAWELDCVACNVVPVDEKHVAVLGLVPSPSSIDVEDSDQNEISDIPDRDYSVAGGDNVLELKIINREDGKSISNDRLPLVEGPKQLQRNQRITTANATEFRLLSSFACPRMDNDADWEALNDAEKEAIRRELRNASSQTKGCRSMPDLHFRWNISKDICSAGKEVLESIPEVNDDDQSVASNCSVCSDNYVFVLSEPIGDLMEPVAEIRSEPPIMTVLYSHDACLVEPRDVDDVISYTRSLGKPAVALKQALVRRRDVRRHGLDQLVDEYLCALLRMGSCGKERPLSFSRLKIAAESLPILLGGDSRMWQRWIFMFSSIPGGLYLIREKIPVRDPHLPGFVFEMSLEKMLEEAIDEQGHAESEVKHQQGKDNRVGEKMADLFLETIRSWGPTSALRRRIQLHRYCAQNQQWGLRRNSLSSGGSVIAPFIRQAEKDLHRRISQTSFGVLSDAHHSTSPSQKKSLRQYIDSSEDSLFDVDHVITRLAMRLQLSGTDNSGIPINNGSSSNILLGNMKDHSAVIVESMAELELMRERFDRALGYYLAIGSHFMIYSLSSLEESAVQCVNSFYQKSASSSTSGQQNKVENDKYAQALSLIELHQLFPILLKRNFFFADEKDDSAAESPIVSLIMLVGLSRAGRFLIDNCAPPESTQQIDSDENSFSEKGASNLPLDLVAKQMKSRPKLLYWFLFQVFVEKSDIYVKFATTAVPPAAITDLHRIQFSLFLDYAKKDGSKRSKSDRSPAGLTADDDTPFMAFLRAALPHGGVQADYVREQLGRYRGGDADSPVFARELAFVIEKFGKATIEDARQILQLYLRGANNLYWAVAFAERCSQYSSMLWDTLVEHCTTPDPTRDTNQNGALGALFGSLLEAAAHTGSDLASLVSRIPEGMSIEGLRPKLIAAITDYRYKVKIHEHVDDMLMNDKISVLRELSHLSRRGERIECRHRGAKTTNKSPGLPSPSRRGLLKYRRLKGPSSHESHSFSLPIR